MSNTVVVREVVNANIHRDIEQSIADPADIVTGLTADKDDLNFLDGSVVGTAVASKALVLGADKDVDTLAIPVGGLKIGAGAGVAVTSSAAELNILTGVTATAAEINNAADLSTLVMTPGGGITAGTGTLHYSSIEKVGNFIKTTIFMDLTGLASSTTDLDIIGDNGTAATSHIGQITAAKNGTIFEGTITWLETPAGGIDDIIVYEATENTGTFDGAITALAETVLYNKGSGAVAAINTKIALTTLPSADKYLYLVNGAGGTAADYTAGQFVLELWGA